MTSAGPPDPRDATCGTCPHARPIEGEVSRIRCAHPATATIPGSLEATIAKTIGNTGPIGTHVLHVIGDAEGVRLGLFQWPFAFEARWLRRCEGWPRPKQVQEADGAPSQRVGPRVHLG
jgi:hypothetical protein